MKKEYITPTANQYRIQTQGCLLDASSVPVGGYGNQLNVDDDIVSNNSMSWMRNK